MQSQKEPGELPGHIEAIVDEVRSTDQSPSAGPRGEPRASFLRPGTRVRAAEG